MKKLKTFFSLFFLLFFYGCSGGSSGSSDFTPFIGGEKATDFKFEPGSPPQEVYDNTAGSFPFDIDVRIKNTGENDIQAGDLNLRFMGILPSDFGVTEADMRMANTQILEKTEKDSDGNIIEGTEANMGVYGLQYQTQLTGNVQFPLRGELCYLYTTRANAKLCYKDDLTDVEDDNVCSPRGTKTAYNSASPVHVSRMEQSVIGTDRVSFTFTISQQGTGNVWRQGGTGSGYTCTWDLPDTESERTYENQVWVHVDTGIGSGLECPSLATCTGAYCEGEVKLYNGQRIVRCTQQTTTGIDFEKLVDIELTYNFEQNIETNLLVKHGI